MVRWIIEDVCAAAALIGFIAMIGVWVAIKGNPQWLDMLEAVQ
jgi:hypothetical protein